ncbi:MAG: DHA2 family efflux MFS transporter permease subunit [Acidobacteriota bacterium]|nr:DHA2 family efflux MFS transporter permease subunit [Acidobacteriota bacterium]
MAQIAARPAFNPWVIAMTVTLATFMEVLDTSIANVALPHIAGNLGATADESTWVQTSYLVSNAIILPMSGWLSTQLGRKRFYMTCVVLFTISSMLCGLATSLPMLILFRVMQGLGGGGLGPSEQAILADTFTPEQRNMGFAIYGMAIVVAPAIGPTLGGWITDNYSWHWIFFINVPIGILSLFLTQRVVHDPPHVLEARERRGGNTDYFGIATIVLGVGFLQYVLDKGEQLMWFDSGVIRIAAAIAAASLVAMIWRELTHAHPIIELRLLRMRNFASATISNFTLGMVLNGSTILIPQFLQLQLGYTAERAGWALSPGGIALAILMPVAGILGSKFDPRKVIAVGFLLTSASMFWMMRITPDIDFTHIVWMRIFQVVGLPLIFIPISTLAYVGMRRQDNNQVSGISNFARNLGGAVGTSFLVTYLTRHRQISRVQLAAHLHHGNVFFDRYLSALQQSAVLGGSGAANAGQHALAQLQQLVDAQANVLAYISAFFVLGVIVALLIPLPFLMKRPSPEELTASQGMH